MREGSKTETMTVTMSRGSETIGVRLRRSRRLAGLTQQELSEQSGVDRATISRIEAGHIQEPHISTLRKFAQTLGVEVRDLIDE
jgi:transcriptional regulator with XRE-family HTH domain